MMPDLEVSATASHETQLTGSPKLPAMELTASTGIRCGTLTLSDLGLSATAQGGLIGTLDKRLPGVTLSATGYASKSASLSVDLPPLEASITIDAETFIALARDLPPLTISAAGSTQLPMSVSGTLPALELTATGKAGSMTLSGYIPPPIMAAIGLGIMMPGGNTIEATDRFDDYVLRHVR